LKIGKYELNFPSFQEKVLEADTARGLWSRTSTVLKYDTKNISQYYQAYLDDDKVRNLVDDLTDAAMGNGYYTTVEEVTPVTQKSKTKDLCDSFGEHFQLDDLLPNIGRNVLIAGFCPCETILQKGGSWDDFSKMSLTIIRPDTIEPKAGIEVDPKTREIVKITQKIGNKENVIRKTGNSKIVNFNYGQLGNDVRGVSFVRGMLNLLNILNDSTDKVNKILDRYLSPIGIWKSRKSVELLKKMVMEREAGEDIFLGNMNADEMKENPVEFLQIDPRIPFWQFIEYLDRRVWSYSRANDLWYVRNATEASANVLDTIVGRHVTSIQRSIKRGVENGWFKPLIDVWYPTKELPSLEFGAEKSGVEEINIEGFLKTGVEVGYIDRNQYKYLLKQLGLDVDQAPVSEEEPEDEAPEELPEKDKLPKPALPEHLRQEEQMFMFDTCMDCDQPPTNEVLWLDKRGTGHAWFCTLHHQKFIKDPRHNILFSRPVAGKATESWAQNYSRRSELT